MDKSKIFQTYNFGVIQELCKDVKENSKMVGLIGYTGAGKTIGERYFKSKNKNVIYTWVRKTMNTKDFYTELLYSSGYEGDISNDFSIYTIMNLIVNTINNTPQKVLLIIDEAGKFTPGQLEYIHELRDLTIGHLGIILSGPEYFEENLHKWKKKNLVGIPEIYRRIQDFITLKRPNLREIRGFCNHYGIEDEQLIKSRFKRSDNFGDLINNIESYLNGNDSKEPY
ncbi:ATP-binding protein [Aquimarina algiphila]|uniref:ATP-binding protein n=1 Tax=Aquimarina algiphila TaxID=2047982 RepID=UPI00248FEB23|nr:ATP-binding protein [Aquimarina algiphila]